MNILALKAALYGRALTKRAALKPDVTLLPHQERVVSKWEGEAQPPGMLIYHGLGSGKTPTSIAVGETMPGIKNVVVPAALRENYRKQLRQFSTDPRKYRIMSYTEALKGKAEAPFTVFDEAHRMGREGTAMSMLPRRMPGRKLLLTGTPVRNEPSEIVPLLKAISSDRPIPQTQEAFDRQFIGTQTVRPDLLSRIFLGVKPGERQVFREPEQFKKLVEGRVDYQPSRGEFPSFAEKHVDVDMTPAQSELYRGVMGGSSLAWKIRLNLPPSKSEAAQLNSFLSGVRQVSNNPAAYDTRMVGNPVDHSPKLQRMIDDVQKGLKNTTNFKGLVYSNYLDAGIVPMSAHLTKLGIPNAIFTGEMNDKLRKKVVDDYNKGDVKVLLVSGAGSEGLDLKGTKMVQVMEPHWNLARTKQVIGRAIRHQSHAHLPPEERFVTVNWYHSKPKQSFLSSWGLLPADRGVDRYLYSRAVEKQQIIDQMLGVLQDAGTKPKPQEAPLAKAAFAVPDPLLDYLTSLAGLKKLQTLARKYRAGASAVDQTIDLLAPPQDLTVKKEEKEAASDLSFGSGGSLLGQMAEYGNKYGPSGMVNWIPPLESKYKYLNAAIMKRINPIKDPAVKRQTSRTLLALLMGKQANYDTSLPDPRRFGDPRQIIKNKLLEWVVQEHIARRSGRHLDVRFGEPGGGPSLYSWATKKELPKPGEKPISLFQQPLHRGTYADFQGTIPSGYGAGEVKQYDRGKISVTEATRDRIKFMTHHKSTPEYFTLVRRSGVPKNPQTARMRSTQGGSWLLINTTPANANQALPEDSPQKVAQAGMTQSALNKLRTAIGSKTPILRDPGSEDSGIYVHPSSRQYIDNLVAGLPAKTRKSVTPGMKRLLRRHGIIYGSDVRSPAVAAHEMGHATGSNMLLPVEATQMNLSPLFSGLMASTMAAHTLRNQPTGLGSSLARVGLTGAIGAGAGLLFHSPTLIEEGRASLRGLKALRDAGFSDKDVTKAREDMWNAYKSYLSHSALRPAAYAALGTGAALGISGLRTLLAKRRR